MTHIPEPWHVERGLLVVGPYEPVPEIPNAERRYTVANCTNKLLTFRRQKANARRVAVCVNAMQTVPTEVIEIALGVGPAPVQRLIEALESIGSLDHDASVRIAIAEASRALGEFFGYRARTTTVA